MILQKSFYNDLVLKKYFLVLLVLTTTETVVLLNIFEGFFENRTFKITAEFLRANIFGHV